MQTLDQNFNYITNRYLIADINQAIWRVNNASLTLTSRAQQLYNEAILMTEYTDWYGYINILTPDTINGIPVSQEFLVRGSGPAPVPEPATMLLIGSGLLGIAGFGRKKINKV